ncbi:hypothetical protein IC582_011748 [Cucumis melo]
MDDREKFEKKIRSYVDQVRLYEDPKSQESARKTVPVDELQEKAIVSLAKEGKYEPSKQEQDHAFLLQLLFWFKQSFRWVNAPSCEHCGDTTTFQDMGDPLPSELQFGGYRVELYGCNSCQKVTRFPRFNNPVKLTETRRGRCGEWANCFTFYCRVFGYESQLILDLTDHVWTECFSHLLGRFMHLDPCEAVYDQPLLYEKGWNKKLNYVIAISIDGVRDVTKHYTRQWNEVLSRRNIITEEILSNMLAEITRQCRSTFTSQLLSELEDRDEKENQARERNSHSVDDSSVSLPGRQSGDKEWRKSRLEIGSDEEGSLSSSACSVRKCVDEHVTRIYSAFGSILSQLPDEEFSKSATIEVLSFIQGIVTDLKKSAFRTRTALVDSDSDETKAFLHRLFPSLKHFLGALSLDSNLDNDGRVEIWLAKEPVYTSLALPVVLDALEEVIQDINKCDNFGRAFLCLPRLKLNRIHSGSVLASGEELPFGIATSAFDGIRSSKWEEPNGAKGCWIMYKVFDNKMEELVAYELISANDAPERDPMDWIVEGSEDGGNSWHLIDEQTNQIFDNRFQRRSFFVTKTGLLSNTFRFRFLAVRDGESTSRLQIGSIDLYAPSFNSIS